MNDRSRPAKAAPEVIAATASTIAYVGDTPRRIWLRRVKGYRKPAGAIVVTRSSKRWGNPYPVDDCWNKAHTPGLHWHVHDGAETVGTYVTKPDAVAVAVDLYRAAIDQQRGNVPTVTEIRRGLAGRDLACWCPLDGQPCHADVLLAIANST